MKPSHDDPTLRQQRAAYAAETCPGRRGRILRWLEPRYTRLTMAGYLLLCRLARGRG